MYTHVCGSIRRLFANFKGFVGSAVSVPLRFLLSHSLMQNLNLHGKQLEGFFINFVRLLELKRKDISVNKGWDSKMKFIFKVY